jgi:hypothetical protein
MGIQDPFYLAYDSTSIAQQLVDNFRYWRPAAQKPWGKACTNGPFP